MLAIWTATAVLLGACGGAAAAPPLRFGIRRRAAAAKSDRPQPFAIAPRAGRTELSHRRSPAVTGQSPHRLCRSAVGQFLPWLRVHSRRRAQPGAVVPRTHRGRSRGDPRRHAGCRRLGRRGAGRADVRRPVTMALRPPRWRAARCAADRRRSPHCAAQRHPGSARRGRPRYHVAHRDRRHGIAHHARQSGIPGRAVSVAPVDGRHEAPRW
jgi:hypothetical protein